MQRIAPIQLAPSAMRQSRSHAPTSTFAPAAPTKSLHQFQPELLHLNEADIIRCSISKQENTVTKYS
jgi:hypothetical protein